MSASRNRTTTAVVSFAAALSLAALSTAAPTVGKDPFTPQQRAWWAFQPVRRPAVPEVKAKDWVRTPSMPSFWRSWSRKAFSLASRRPRHASPARVRST